MRKQLISIIDDDEFIQRLLSDALEMEGFRTIIASSAEDCYRQLGSELPDAFVMDILLPGQNGVQLCMNLRKHPMTQFVPILMLSSKSRVKDRIIGLEAGADDYLVKPFHVDELIARIKALLRRNKEIITETAQRPAKTPPFPIPTDKPKNSIPKVNTASEVTKPSNSQNKSSIKIPFPVFDAKPELTAQDADFDTRKKYATELYQKRLYDKAYQIFDSLHLENPKDQYVKKYVEVTKTSLMKHYLTLLGNKDSIPVRTSDRPEDFIGLDFNTQEGFIFSRIDGITDFKGIVAISGMKPLTAYGILFNLMQSGVIRISGSKSS